MIYLDNAATGGFKPEKVKDELLFCIENSANPTRSSHKRALEIAEKCFVLRKEVCKLFNFPHIDRVIFTKNCTESLNMAILGSVKRGGHVIVDCYAHNSLLRPLYSLKKREIIDLTVLYPTTFMGKITLKDVISALNKRTYLVCLTHVSNVVGVENDVEKVGQYLKNTNVLFLIDGAQSGGYLDIDYQKCHFDFLCLPAHKGLSCPTGLGFLLISKKAKITPLLLGGTGIKGLELDQPHVFPEGYESGTLPTVAICGGVEGIKYVNENSDKIKDKMSLFANCLYGEKLPSTIILKSVKNNCGLFSFVIKGKDPSFIANVLDQKYSIALRSGYFCAPLIHRHLGTKKQGLIRASFCSFNDLSDVQTLFSALKELS